MKGEKLFVEKHCEICNKLFYVTGMWAYKIQELLIGVHYYCSWTCYNKGKDKFNAIKSKNRKKRSTGWRYGEK